MPERRRNLGPLDPKNPSVTNLAVVLDSPVLDNVTVEVKEATGQTVTVGYRTIPGNRPMINGNKLWLWEGTVIGWSHPEEGISELITSNDTFGSFTMTDVSLSHKEYIVGYSVTGDVMGICASALASPPRELLMAPTSVMLEIDSLTPEKLVISYATLRGYRPLSAGNWLGLWRGDVLPWDAPPPTEVTQPEDDVNEGLATFKAVLRARSTYTVIYFMAYKDQPTSNTSAAAMLRFDTT